MQDRGGDEQLHPRHQPEQPAAQGERFHRLGLEDTPEELTGALMAHLLRRKPQGPSEEALLEEPSSADGESPLRPDGEQTERHQGHEQKRPSQQPAGVESTLQRPLTDHPPGQQPEQVLPGVTADKRQETRRQAGLARLVPEAGARWQA